jgi:transcription initiation factor IIE alpha subunit
LEQPASVQNRKLHPTCDKHGNVEISKRTVTKRRSETFEMVKKIHVCTSETILPALFGLVDTLSVKFKKTDLVSEMSIKDKLCTKVFPIIYNEKVAKFEECEDNIVRSIATYYTKGVMGQG